MKLCDGHGTCSRAVAVFVGRGGPPIALAWRSARWYFWFKSFNIPPRPSLPWRQGKKHRMAPSVEAVSQHNSHRFSKQPRMWIRLLAGLGVEGDAHLGTTVQHRSRVARDPSQPNLRQVHLLHRELLEALEARGFIIGPGDIGENVLTRGLDLLALPTDTVLRLGLDAEVRVTGLRNPCVQLDRFKPGLMAATLDRDAVGNLVRKAGVMAVVVTGGDVRPGDAIQVILPPTPHRRLVPV